MKKNSIILLIVIVAVIIGIGSVYYYKNKTDQPAVEVEEITNEFIDSVSVPDLPQEEQELLDKIKTELKDDPNNVDNLLNLAQYQKLAGDYEGGVKTLKYAYSLDPQRHVIINNLIDLYFINQQYDEAEEWCFILIKYDRLWKNSYTFLRDIYKFHKKEKYYDSDEFPELINNALAVTVLKGDQKFFLLMLINYYMDTDDSPNVISHANKFLMLDPENQMMKDLIAEHEKILIN